MKYCVKCGTELVDEAIACVKCGCATELYYQCNAVQNSGIKTIVKVFMILGTILSGIFIFPLAWSIPMTAVYFNRVKNNQPISTGFKVCSLLFVSMVGGIIMLCEDD